MKLAKLSPPEGFCCDDSSACRPALRFFARFLLLAFAFTAGFGFSMAVFEGISILLSGAFECIAFAGAGSVTLVMLWQWPQVRILDGPAGEAAAFAAREVVDVVFLREIFRVSSFSVVEWPGTMM